MRPAILNSMAFFKPTYLVDGDLTDLSLQQLRKDGIKGIIFDLDSTLIAPRTARLSNEVATWLSLAREEFKLAVVSNNKNDVYMQQVQSVLNMPVLGRAAKPATKVFLQVLADFELPPHEVVVVGDRPLTDIWGGQRAGMKTALVMPLKTQIESKLVIIARKLERCFIRS
ncbi:MAG TPA: YqeG family HAD IIIA-type phosphatase [Oculatellaceae cyanobacterium]